MTLVGFGNKLEKILREYYGAARATLPPLIRFAAGGFAILWRLRAVYDFYLCSRGNKNSTWNFLLSSVTGTRI